MPVHERKRLWSPDRPKRPDHDPLLADLREALAADQRSTWAKANVSGLAPATLANIQKGVTRRPTGITIQMAYAMLGYELVKVKTTSLRYNDKRKR